MAQIRMALVGVRGHAHVSALAAAGVECWGVANEHPGYARLAAWHFGAPEFPGPAAVHEMLTRASGRVDVVVIDGHHSTPPVLAKIDWPAVVVLDSPPPQAICEAQRLSLASMVSNPLLHSLEVGGWRRLAQLVGEPWSVEIEYVVDAGGSLGLSQALLGHVLGVAWEAHGPPVR